MSSAVSSLLYSFNLDQDLCDLNKGVVIEEADVLENQ